MHEKVMVVLAVNFDDQFNLTLCAGALLKMVSTVDCELNLAL